MQILTGARTSGGRARVYPPDADAVNAVLTASRSLIAVATRSLGGAAEETTIAQYRTLVVLASRGPQRIVDLAAALDVATLPGDAQQGVAEALRTFADAAGEVPDSQWPPAGSAEEVARPRVHSRPIGVAQRGRP